MCGIAGSCRLSDCDHGVGNGSGRTDVGVHDEGSKGDLEVEEICRRNGTGVEGKDHVQGTTDIGHSEKHWTDFYLI